MVERTDQKLLRLLIGRNPRDILKDNSKEILDMRYSWYVLVILTLSFAVSFIDRQVLTLLIEPIKSDLNISDTQVSLLIGLAFSLFYISMAIPIARLVDKGNRINIIATGVFFWSIMTGLCGFAKNYWQLFIARMGVGVGEATLTPAVYSLIPDYFPKNKLGTAVGFYMLGMSLGTGFALVLGAAILSYVNSIGDITIPLIGTLRPWQVTFVIVGFPGVLLALLIKLSIREPSRRNIFEDNSVDMSEVTIIPFLRSNFKTMICIIVAYSFGGMVFYGFLTWIPEHLRRAFEWDISNAGYVFGLLLATLGSLGAVLGGKFHDYLYSKGYKDAPIRCALIIFSLLLPIMVITPLVKSSELSIIMLGIFSFTMFLQQAMSPVAIQMIAPNHIRAQVVAIFFFVSSFFSIAIGPSIVAIFTDYIFMDESKLYLSISLVAMIFLPFCILALYLCLKPFRESVDNANKSPPPTESISSIQNLHN